MTGRPPQRRGGRCRPGFQQQDASCLRKWGASCSKSRDRDRSRAADPPRPTAGGSACGVAQPTAHAMPKVSQGFGRVGRRCGRMWRLYGGECCRAHQRSSVSAKNSSASQALSNHRVLRVGTHSAAWRIAALSPLSGAAWLLASGPALCAPAGECRTG